MKAALAFCLLNNCVRFPSESLDHSITASLGFRLNRLTSESNHEWLEGACISLYLLGMFIFIILFPHFYSLMFLYLILYCWLLQIALGNR